MFQGEIGIPFEPISSHFHPSGEPPVRKQRPPRNAEQPNELPGFGPLET
jgi:hypothetical protein